MTGEGAQAGAPWDTDPAGLSWLQRVPAELLAHPQGHLGHLSPQQGSATGSPAQPSRTNPSWATTGQVKAFPAFSSCQLSAILACATCPWSCSPLNLIPRGTGTWAWPAAVILIMLFSKDSLEQNICILAKRLQLGGGVQWVFRWGKAFKSCWNLLLQSSKIFSFIETYIHHCSLRVEVSLCKRPLKCKNRSRPSLCCTSGYVQGRYWSQKLHIRGS